MADTPDPTQPLDIFIIGGGVNGCGIARDAAGRGLRVTLAEMNDLASATSSASTKLFHGGLRYLEYFEINLVRHALKEREILLRAMPHISWPMRFVLPYHRDMRFEGETPVSKILNVMMPWLRGSRPAWLIRAGLFLYDTLGGRKILPATRSLDLRGQPEGAPLDPRFVKAFEYSDCWIEDSRLVVLNARDAQNHGAQILTQTKVISAARVDDLWQIKTEGPDGIRTHHARILVNAGGPWVGQIIHDTVHVDSREGVRLVRGSHIVTRKLFDHDKCYFFQGADGRIIFAIPYEGDFTLIGTTDADHPDPDTRPICTPEERDYLIDFANEYFAKNITADDVVWTYSGVRPLYDDGATSATAATRDYVLKVDGDGAPVLNIFGGKITTYRVLAEDVMDKLAPFIPNLKPRWTAGAPLPGGDFAVGDVAAQIAALLRDYPFLTPAWAKRLIRAYGTDARVLLGGAKTSADLGRDFGATLSAAEVRYLMRHEFARNSDDILWRRSKLGLRLDAEHSAALDTFISELPEAP
ncbi:glycerol-3-phosphate dehydrogenase [Sulfitobacter sp. F26169L]|uniref:glycerol-3-phosphate dehydrogenase n=1 Tax=Sulfitobacter sp. F26169L TaxID=2996015 RepID=UPI002260A66C|nr:glycerol-3-phosphate dehydrogenase [Sulfitobacter sp. F26169L]MCX7568144.1 glycerol-3-phosphate dehydrogenase [Sulfitobacter sp. F26169L]